MMPLIMPYVETFYADKIAGVGPEIIPLQFLRGALYLAFSLPLIRSLVGSRWQVAVQTALLFPVLAGAIDLLIPNPHMPDWVRPFHTLEIGASNMVFGLLVGLWFWNPRAGQVAGELTTQPVRRTQPPAFEASV